MKKIRKICLFVLVLFPAALSAQVKFGHVMPEDIMGQMPGFDTAQTQMSQYQDELQQEYQTMMQEFQEKVQAYQQQMSAYSDAVRKIKEEELAAMQSRIQEFSASVEMSLQKKKTELLTPFQDKILEAISAVAKEEHFTYIFNKSILSFSDAGIDISGKVREKLGIK
ncbi:MAG: OmpH family outer membrane protein [Bacteroidales bacterium]|nr:OmpH family outer membrane protein [Bacteroidales bacterium]